jgi:hypothetical protein
MELPSSRTRSTSVVALPTPGTVAVMIEPPTEPTFGERPKNFGDKVISYSTNSFPSGSPTSKKTFDPFRIKSSESIIEKIAEVASTDFVSCFF